MDSNNTTIRTIANWGNYPTYAAKEFSPNSLEELQEIVRTQTNILARGNGRCYGDAALNGCVVNMLPLKTVISFDKIEGILVCEAGLLLSDIIEQFLPEGFFLPVTPGTKFITIGGAIASDVHGKNHHSEGCFSDHVLWIEVMREDGSIVRCSQSEQSELFWQTVGGMGLTGIICRAAIRLKKVETAYIRQESIKAENLEEIFRLFEESERFTYYVAWIDCLQRGKNIGRSILMRGEHAKVSELTEKLAQNPLSIKQKKKIKIPFFFPEFVLNSLSVKLFNFLFYHKQREKLAEQIIDYDTFFYPLDAILEWNKIYGKRGFIQYQMVIPKERGYDGMKEILETIATSRQGSFLAVLKLFGKNNPLAINSFPFEGYTLALDFKVTDSLPSLVEKLDSIVEKYGGRIYRTKDAMSSHHLTDYLKLPSTQKFQSLQQHRIQKQKSMEISGKTLVVIGSNSDVSKAFCRIFFRQDSAFKKLVLVSSHPEKSKNFSNEMKDDFGVDVSIIKFDLSSTPNFDELQDILPDVVFCAAGYLGKNTHEGLYDDENSQKIININYGNLVLVLNHLAKKMELSPGGTIIGLSSVAGMRGRQSNFMYGSAKAAFTAYLSGLRNYLFHKGVHVLTVIPGYMQTEMTKGMKLPKPLTSTPEKAASLIFSAYRKKKNVVFIDWKWFYLMWVIRFIPEFIFKKLKM